MKTTMFPKSVSKSPFDLTEGDIIKTSVMPGQLIVFLSWKQGMNSYVGQGLETGKRYKIRVPHGVIMSDAKYEVLGQAILEKSVTEYDLLRKSPIGTLFVTQNKKTAEIFRLKGFSPSGKIKAENPLDGTGFNIDSSFIVKLVSNLK